MQLLEHLDDLGVDFEPRQTRVSMPNTRPRPYRLRTPGGGSTLPCATLLDVVRAVRFRAGVQHVIVEVWRTHYRLRDEERRCIGVVRFTKDPITWSTVPTKPLPLPRNTPQQYAFNEEHTCAFCGVTFTAPHNNRRQSCRAFCSSRCGRILRNREHKARMRAAQ